jgi:cobaltochelatase CobS
MSVGQYRAQFPQAEITSRVLEELSKQVTRAPQGTDVLETFLPQFMGPTTAAADLDQLKAHFGPTKPENLLLVPTTNPDFVLDDNVAAATTFALLKGKNTYIEGPTGCGKTDGVKQIHARLGLPIKRVNMNGDVTTANFIGSKHADPQTGTYFRHGNLPLAMTGGYTLLIDEIDYMPASIAAVLNPVLEGARELYLPDTDEHIVAEKGFLVIGLANTGGKGDTTGVYTGTEILNTAFLDRFAVKLKMDYLEASAEIDMLTQRFPTVSHTKIWSLVTVARDVRDQFRNGLIPVTLSTRKLIDIFEMEPVLGLRPAVECALLNWLDEDCIELVKKIFENRGMDLR